MPVVSTTSIFICLLFFFFQQEYCTPPIPSAWINEHIPQKNAKYFEPFPTRVCDFPPFKQLTSERKTMRKAFYLLKTNIDQQNQTNKQANKQANKQTNKQKGKKKTKKG
eukprot:TRINITY_DN3875_c0_g1_i1.p1 TRINITY_DN3875_c0_g1~~TRINITY_DN3875_c0_g1_i1.p1  ORF type:complete len:109 (+),score=17.76 TRINITY_DN3875_c0_g1_i1:300-626(+)